MIEIETVKQKLIMKREYLKIKLDNLTEAFNIMGKAQGCVQEADPLRFKMISLQDEIHDKIEEISKQLS